MGEGLDLTKAVGPRDPLKLSNGETYGMVNPEHLGAIPLSEALTNYQRATEMASSEDPEDIAAALMHMLDALAVIVPDAPREELGQEPLSNLLLVGQYFTVASPDDEEEEPAVEATSEG